MSIKDINIQIGFKTKDIMRLKAIGKYTSELADELERIKNLEECEVCGDVLEVNTIYADGVIRRTQKHCANCEKNKS